jgi:Skp family chaperone for outer membrane proteins
MRKTTSVNLDGEAVEYFKEENINISAWIRDIMEQRMFGGDVDVVSVRIRELERKREDHATAIERIDEELEELKDKEQQQNQVEDANRSFDESVIVLHKEFQAFPTADRLRSSQAFRRRASEEDMSVFEAADAVIDYREAIGYE